MKKKIISVLVLIYWCHKKTLLAYSPQMFLLKEINLVSYFLNFFCVSLLHINNKWRFFKHSLEPSCKLCEIYNIEIMIKAIYLQIEEILKYMNISTLSFKSNRKKTGCRSWLFFFLVDCNFYQVHSSQNLWETKKLKNKQKVEDY